MSDKILHITFHKCTWYFEFTFNHCSTSNEQPDSILYSLPSSRSTSKGFMSCFIKIFFFFLLPIFIDFCGNRCYLSLRWYVSPLKAKLAKPPDVPVPMKVCWWVPLIHHVLQRLLCLTLPNNSRNMSFTSRTVLDKLIN